MDFSKEKTKKHTFTCARTICKKEFTKDIWDVVYFCGVPEQLCNECTNKGYTVNSGAGDGRTEVYDASGELIESYHW